MTKCKICGKVHRTPESAIKAHGNQTMKSGASVSARMPGLKKKYTAAARHTQSRNAAGLRKKGK